MRDAAGNSDCEPKSIQEERLWRNICGKYLTGRKAPKGFLKDGGTKRRQVVEAAIKANGGKLEVFYLAFGKNDAYLIADVPDHVSGRGSRSGCERQRRGKRKNDGPADAGRDRSSVEEERHLHAARPLAISGDERKGRTASEKSNTRREISGWSHHRSNACTSFLNRTDKPPSVRPCCLYAETQLLRVRTSGFRAA